MEDIPETNRLHSAAAAHPCRPPPLSYESVISQTPVYTHQPVPSPFSHGVSLETRGSLDTVHPNQSVSLSTAGTTGLETGDPSHSTVCDRQPVSLSSTAQDAVYANCCFQLFQSDYRYDCCSESCCARCTAVFFCCPGLCICCADFWGQICCAEWKKCEDCCDICEALSD